MALNTLLIFSKATPLSVKHKPLFLFFYKNFVTFTFIFKLAL
ncbi:hypothetical protein A464_1553 [Salmonella bongori N268-08]|uniref:Uncharacterized protein n=1 Tax=Salmonella bongori N268-08 TaxID=1197719 RepID=S5MVV5_SALBN|nr:hypothetical protein A464_1553 [Salmonella bongori N268-08]